MVAKQLVFDDSKMPFFKMNGCGNDFVVLDGRGNGALSAALTPELRRLIASRGEGIGCDQLLVILDGAEGIDAVMDVYNADGSSSLACGNGARCIALLLGESRIGTEIVLQAGERQLECRITGNGQVCVDMGIPVFSPDAIPLSLPVEDGAVLSPALFAPPMLQPADIAGAVSMGNPHCVFFFNEANALNDIDLASLGPLLEYHDAFPERANISFVHVGADGSFHLRVWERGAGATLCCGTAACAAFALARRHGLCARTTRAHLPGGTLELHQRENDGHILMGGAAVLEYEGVFDALERRVA
ncbi:MAG: diaminopimelate epimerase [Hyphomicrobiales bacterium]|nr:diaminopimelate epimerase [Hyphomicrobiales bacterium]MCY4052592.1 diaminopimelate epimerase [Hyphomicrobiales bacterium]